MKNQLDVSYFSTIIFVDILVRCPFSTLQNTIHLFIYVGRYFYLETFSLENCMPIDCIFSTKNSMVVYLFRILPGQFYILLLRSSSLFRAQSRNLANYVVRHIQYGNASNQKNTYFFLVGLIFEFITFVFALESARNLDACLFPRYIRYFRFLHRYIVKSF